MHARPHPSASESSRREKSEINDKLGTVLGTEMCQRSRFSELIDTLRTEAEPKQPAGAISTDAAKRRSAAMTTWL